MRIMAKMNLGDRNYGSISSGFRKLIIGTGITVGLGLAAIMGYDSTFTYIKPNEVGIKQSKFSEGLDKKNIYRGGEMYCTPPGVTFHTFPTTKITLDFNDRKMEADLEGKVAGYDHEPALKIPSSDGFQNTFEITIIYHITDAQRVRENSGIGEGYKEYVKTKVQPALLKTLGVIPAEGLITVTKRIDATRAAAVMLSGELTPVGMDVDDVLIRKFSYPESYQAKIHATVLQEQLGVTRIEQRKAAEREAEVKKIDSQGLANVEVEKQRAKSLVQTITAGYQNYQNTKNAEGELLVKKAEAEGQRQVNLAYEGAGAERILGVQMAKTTASAIKHIYVESCKDAGANPLDLTEMLSKFTARGGAK